MGENKKAMLPGKQVANAIAKCFSPGDPMKSQVRNFMLALITLVSMSAFAKDKTSEDFVVCTGWHALCSASPDCKVKGDKAYCDCMRVNEPHIVATGEIQDPLIKRLTLARCTKKHPCAVDQAPVCKAIKYGFYKVDHVKYKWVSTYSYRGWCDILAQKFVACDQSSPGYSGDLNWAICDAAPCRENANPSDPKRPLSCECRVESTPFVGIGDCTGDNGGIISSFPVELWDFKNNTYPFPMPGYEFVRGACAEVGSDPKYPPSNQ